MSTADPYRTPAPDPVDQLRDEVKRLREEVVALRREVARLDRDKQPRTYGGLGC